MAVRTREEILDLVRTRIGDQTDDESISFLEDITDTLEDYETKVKGDGEDWKAKYEENDKIWREKYTNRFFNKNDSNIEPKLDDEDDEDDEPKTFEDLFDFS